MDQTIYIEHITLASVEYQRIDEALNLSLFFTFKGVSDIWHVLIELFPTKTKLSFLSYSLVWKLRLWALSWELREVEVFNFPDSEKNCTICSCVVMLRTLGLGLREGGIGVHFSGIGYHLLGIVCVGSVKCWASLVITSIFGLPRVHTPCKHCFSHAHPSSGWWPLLTIHVKTLLLANRGALGCWVRSFIPRSIIHLRVMRLLTITWWGQIRAGV